MKTIKLIIAAALLTGVSTLAVAGPGPQFWAQQTKNVADRKAQKEAAAQVATQAKAEAAPLVAVCANCNCCAKKS